MTVKKYFLKANAFIIALYLIFVFVITAFAAEPTIGIKNLEAKAGNEVILPVEISAKSGIAALDFTVKYDNDKLQLIAVTDYFSQMGILGSVNDKAEIDGKKAVKAALAHVDGISDGGALIELKFRVNKDAKGLAAVELLVEDDSAHDTNFQVLKVNVQNGGVNIKSVGTTNPDVVWYIVGGFSALILVVAIFFIIRKKRSLK